MGGIPTYFKAPSSGASGHFVDGTLSAIAITNPNGVSVSPDFTANEITGGYNVADSLSPMFANIYFALTNKLKVKTTNSLLSLESTSPEEPENSISVYPNPTHDKITVTLPGGINQDIIVLDINGRQIAHFETSLSTFEIDVDNWAIGVYTVSIHSGTNNSTTKIVKY